MYQSGVNQALNEYRHAGVLAEVHDSSPYRLIQMLFAGALERLVVARYAMERGNIPLKGERIGKVIDILENLRASLDLERGGELAANLEALYDYMQRRLVVANVHNDLTVLDEVTRLLRSIKDGWDGISAQAA